MKNLEPIEIGLQTTVDLMGEIPARLPHRFHAGDVSVVLVAAVFELVVVRFLFGITVRVIVRSRIDRTDSDRVTPLKCRVVLDVLAAEVLTERLVVP